MSDTMTLAEAIERGSQKYNWTTHYVYTGDEACALGLAATGIGLDLANTDASRPRVDQVVEALGMRSAAWLSREIANINNACISYEEMMLELKRHRLSDLVVGGDVITDNRLDGE